MGHVPPRDRVGLTPEDLLRALLDEGPVAAVLTAAGTSSGELRLAVERRWLATLDGVDEAILRGRRADVAALLQALNAASPELDGVSPEAKVVLAHALRESAALRARRITSEHLLVALLAGHDPVVAAAAAEIGLRPARVRRIVARRSRRAG
jgi:ATP-dependent Clp protease ATP-binding subunit ClpA